LLFSISRASSSYDGAITISKKILFISLAVSASIFLFVVNTPPNAETGSPASAAFHASVRFSLDARPQALLCFNHILIKHSGELSIVKYENTNNGIAYCTNK
jgi:hypothetical protein